MGERYWVGGTASWDATAGTKWALTSGGAGGQAVPGTGDNVYFDGNSGAVVVTVAATVNSLNLDFTGYTGTFAGSSTVNVFGNITYAAGMTLTHTGTVEFEATGTGKTVTSNGLTTNHRWLFKGVGGGWTLQDNVTKSTSSNTTGNIGLTNGTLDLNGKTLDLWSFSITGTATRALVMGACTLKIRSTSTGGSDGFQLASVTGFTLTENTGTVQFTGTTGAFNGSTETWYAVTSTSITGSLNIRGGGSYTNISVTGVAAEYFAELFFNASTTITGTLTVTGNSATNRISIQSSLGDGREITLTAAAVSLTNVDFMDITGAGAATWSGTSLGDGGNNSGITFTAAVTRYWVGDGGAWDSTTHWSTSTGGASGASVPICHDTVIFDANSFTLTGQTVTTPTAYLGKDITFTGTNAPTYSFTSNGARAYFFGDVSFASGATYVATSVNYFSFNGRTATTVTFNGTVFDDTTGVEFEVSKGYDGAGASVGSLTLADDFSAGNGPSVVSWGHVNGTLDFNDKNVKVGGIATFSGGGQFKLGNGIITLTDSDDASYNGSIMYMSDFSDGVIDAADFEGSTIKINTDTMTASGNAEIYFYSDPVLTYAVNKMIFEGHRSVTLSTSVDPSATLTFAVLEIKSEEAAKTVSFDHNSSTVQTITSFLVTGTPYARTTMNSTTAANAADVAVTGSRIYFADIKDMNFSSGVTAFCSTSVSNNTNLTLSTSALCKTVGASMSAYCLPNIY